MENALGKRRIILPRDDRRVLMIKFHVVRAREKFSLPTSDTTHPGASRDIHTTVILTNFTVQGKNSQLPQLSARLVDLI